MVNVPEYCYWQCYLIVNLHCTEVIIVPSTDHYFATSNIQHINDDDMLVNCIVTMQCIASYIAIV